ncbi:MAG: PAS domain S-box protein [Candidatus Omnitrophica bacterium]|nr:PAS domain S-box protein [Candidatus Omnitrophota bacterium]
MKSKNRIKEEFAALRLRIADLGSAKRRSEKDEALSASEARYKELFNNIGSCAVIFEAVDDGRDFVFKDINKSTERLEKVRRKDIIGKSVTAVFPDIKEIGLFEVLQEVWMTGNSAEHPTAYYSEGTVAGWKDNYVYRLPSGEIVVVYDDVTEQKRAEEDTKALSLTLEKIIEGTLDLIFVKDTAGRYIMVNLACADFFELSKEEIIGGDDADLFSPETARSLMETDLRVMRSGKTEVLEEKVEYNGEEHIFISTKSPNFDGEGKVTGITCVMRDITDREKAKSDVQEGGEELREEREKLQEKSESLREESEKLQEKSKKLQKESEKLQGERTKFLEESERLSRESEKLREEKENIKKVIDAVPGLVYEIYAAPNGEMKWMFLNNMAEEFFGMAPEEVIGDFRLVFEKVVPEDQEALRNSIADAVRKRVMWEHECRYIAPDGSTRGVYCKGNFVREDNSGGTVWAGVIIDNTVKKNTEKELKNITDRFRDIALTSGDWIWEIEREGKFTYVAGNVKQILGYGPEEILGKTPFDFMTSDEAARTLVAFKAFREQKKPIKDLENWNIAKNGEKVLLVTNGTATFDDNGTFTGYRGVNKDITLKRKTEREMRRLQKQMEYILGATKTGLDIIDGEFNIIYIDPEWEKTYGEPAGRKCYEYFDDRKEPCPECGMLKALSAKKVVVTEKNLPKEGMRPVQITSIPYRDDDGKWRVAEVRVDISEIKKARSEITTIQSKFEGDKEKLTESMTQLVQAEKMIALGELTAGIAHELNQPLNIIKIIAQMMQRNIEKGDFSVADAKNDLPEIVNQVNRMAEIIKHMRVFTRSTVGTDMVESDINVVVHDLLTLLSQQYRDHNIELVVTLGEHLPLVKIDQIRVEQVLLNLLNNAMQAVEAAAKSPKKIEIKTYTKEDNKKIVMEVIDNGIGVPDEVKTKIVQPFFTTKEPGKGTGLGLSVSNKIAEEHGGNLEFTSVQGEGTAFRLVLPVAA